MIVDKNSGQHLNIAMGRSLLIFTALLELFLVFFLFHTFLPFLFLLRTFWSLGCSLTALGFFGTPTGKAAVKVINKDFIQNSQIFWMELTLPPFVSPFCPFWICAVSPPRLSSATRKPGAGESRRYV